MSMTRNSLALEIIESRSGNDRLNHCIDVLFETTDLDYDYLLITIELIIKEALLMKLRTEQIAKQTIAEEQKKTKSRAARAAKYLNNEDRSFLINSMNDPILEAALKVIKNNA
jgi:hypothetical protein